jgi:hypothetical protein
MPMTPPLLEVIVPVVPDTAAAVGGRAEHPALTPRRTAGTWSTKIYGGRTTSGTYFMAVQAIYGWIPHNAGFGFLDLTPSILHYNWFWDYIS